MTSDYRKIKQLRKDATATILELRRQKKYGQADQLVHKLKTMKKKFSIV